MYTQSQPTLPSLTAAIGKGVVDSYSPSSLTNGDISQHQIKQEQDFEHSPPSLPPLRNTSVNQNNNNNHSRMSINQLCNDTESEYPEDVKEAAAVLENMKTNAVTSSPSLANVSSQPQQPQQPQLQSQQLEPRTNPEPSQLPSSPSTDTGFMSAIVKKTMSAYEQGKATSPFIKCATEMVEHGVSRFSKPVIEHFAIVDQYARGLNRNEKTIEDGEHGLVNNSNNSNNNNDNSSNHNNNNINNKSNNNDEGGKYGIEKDDAIVQSESEVRKRKVMSENSRSSSPSYRNPSRSHRTSQSSGSSNSSSYAPYTYSNSTVSATTSSSSTGTRSRWQQMVIGTGAAVGAAGAAVSEESMKSLKYCLQWINYATQHIDAQIAVLREFIVNLTNPSQRAVVHTSSTSTLSSIKKEVIDTLRKVIEVVSKYAGACLPDHAKISVKNYILSLPGRWASINHTEHSSSPSPMSSPQLAPANGHPLNQTADYARRLLSLATESLDMLRSVAGIFGETVGRAEAIVEKLKAVGVTSGGASAMGNLHFDNIWSSQSNNYNVYSSSSTSSHSSSGRSRRSSNTVRMNNHGPRKHSRPTPPVHLDDDDSILNGHYSDSSSDSDVEPMRMEMDNVQKRALKNANAKSQQQHANGVIKKRKKDKVSKKENDKMDLSS